MTQAISVHGWADASGKLTTDLLHPYFTAEGYECESYDIGFHLLVSLRANRWARELAARVKPNSVGIGHSFGCLLLQKAAFLGAPFSQLVFINPALPRDAKLPPHIHDAHVWFSRGDVGLRLSPLFWWTGWGDMGARGPTGNYPPWTGYDKSSDRFAVRSYTHLDVFWPEQLAFFGPMIARRVREMQR